MMTRREYHFVYGKGLRQGWEETALGWKLVDNWDVDQWPSDSYTVVEWPHYIPDPVGPGCPPRERW